MCRLHSARVLVLSFLLCAAAPLALAQSETPPPEHQPESALDARVAFLEQEVQELRAEVAELRQQESAAPGATPVAAPAATPAVYEVSQPSEPPVAQPSEESASLPAEQPALPSAPEPAPQAPPQRLAFLGGAMLTGSLDIYYSYNAQQPVSGLSSLRLFDDQTNQIALNLLEFGIYKKPTDESRLGYNFTLGFGNAINVVNSSDSGFAQYLEQGYASYLAPVGRGLQVDFGKFDTPAGPEAIESYANWNYSRGLLFDYAVPFYVFGGRAQYAFTDTFKMTGYVVNGWDNLVDTYSSGKTLGARLDWKPAPKILVSETWFGGRAPTVSSLGRRDLSDTTIVYSATNKLSLMANADYSLGALLPRFQLPVLPVHWFGIAGYGRYQFTRLLASALRFEHYDDPSGISTCGVCTVLIPDRIDEITATGELRFRHFVTRFESRYDRSKPALFTQDNYRFPTQLTLSLGLMYVIEPQDRFKPFPTEFGLN